MKSDANPMQSAHVSPRCTAHSKRSGLPCKNPAVRGWSACRMHGAGGGQPAGAKHPAWKHGLRSREWVNERRWINELVSEAREISESSVNRTQLL